MNQCQEPIHKFSDEFGSKEKRRFIVATCVSNAKNDDVMATKPKFTNYT